MSQENVELVRALQPPPDMDITTLFMRGAEDDDATMDATIAAAEPYFTPDFVCVFHALSDEPRPGVRGLRAGWLDWLEQWESYRAEIDELRDLGDKVAVFSRDFGRRPGMADEVEFRGIAVYTVREGKVSRAEFFTDRGEALEAMGLRE